uniref:Uncharacterized protein n=1 Tax=Plectus sambesii TaxID=2011161 RepID=A0A914X642_9BILA
MTDYSKQLAVSCLLPGQQRVAGRNLPIPFSASFYWTERDAPAAKNEQNHAHWDQEKSENGGLDERSSTRRFQLQYLQQRVEQKRVGHEALVFEERTARQSAPPDHRVPPSEANRLKPEAKKRMSHIECTESMSQSSAGPKDSPSSPSGLSSRLMSALILPLSYEGTVPETMDFSSFNFNPALHKRYRS